MNKEMNPYLWWYLVSIILTGGTTLFLLPIALVIYVMVTVGGKGWRNF